MGIELPSRGIDRNGRTVEQWWGAPLSETINRTMGETAISPVEPGLESALDSYEQDQAQAFVSQVQPRKEEQ